MPVLESLCDKVAVLKACKFTKKRLQHKRFPVKFTNFLRTPILKKICEGLLLSEGKKMTEKDFQLVKYVFI